jgi:hypothetical protein
MFTIQYAQNRYNSSSFTVHIRCVHIKRAQRLFFCAGVVTANKKVSTPFVQYVIPHMGFFLSVVTLAVVHIKSVKE